MPSITWVTGHVLNNSFQHIVSTMLEFHLYCIYLISTLIACVLQTNPAVSRYYLQFLDTTGLSVSIGQIRWYTTSFNRLLLRFGQWKARWLQAWFTGGMYFGVVAMFVAVILLVVTLINAVKRKPAEKQVLTPVVRIVRMLLKIQLHVY